MEMSLQIAAYVRILAPARFRLNQETHQNLRIVRNLLLILLAGAAAAISADAVLSRRPSGLDADGLALAKTGAPVSRQWIDFNAISPSLPRSVVARRGREILQPSRHRLGRAARRDRRRRGRRGRRAAARPSPSRWRKTCSCGRAAAWSARRWSCRSRCGSISCCRSSGSWKSISTSPSSARPASSAREPAPAYAFGRPASALSPREAALLAAILPNPVRRSARNPGPGVRRLAGTYMARAQAAGCSDAGAKIALLSRFCAILPDRHPSFAPTPSSISAALSAFQLAPKRCSRPPTDDASDNTPRGHRYGRSPKKTSPSRRGMRRSADALKKPTYVEDKDSGELRRPHHLDLKTGMYKGRQRSASPEES